MQRIVGLKPVQDRAKQRNTRLFDDLNDVNPGAVLSDFDTTVPDSK